MSASEQQNTRSQSALFTRLAAAGVKFLHSLRSSLNPSAEEAWLVAAQLRHYRNSTRHTTLLVIVSGFVIALGTAGWVSPERRFGWWIALAIVGGALDVLARIFDRAGLDTREKVARRALMHVFDSAVLLVVWCSMSVVLWVPGNPLNHMMLMLILACTLSGSVSLNAVHPATAVSVFAIVATFMIVPTVFSPAPLDHLLAVLATLFLAIMSEQALVIHAQTDKMFVLEHERAGLVKELQSAKAASGIERGKAESAGRAKSQFLSHMNHELRTPMNAILGFSELINTKSLGNAVDKYAEYAGVIHESGQQLLDLIDGMLNLAKIDGGKLYLREGEFSLAQLISEQYDSEYGKAEERGVKFVLEIAPDLPDVRADERALRQIVSNLLSNALKYTSPGGHVEIFARQEDGIVFGVKDTGIGIAPEDREHVFERFGKGRHDVTTADRGTGLGLAIVKGFAEAHDGSVTLDSELGFGTCVTVRLPPERVLATPDRLTA